jgi:hypothetical protein
MPESRDARSLLATAVGWVLVAIVGYVVLRVFLGSFFWLIRTAIVVLVIGGLLTLYVSLKSPHE